MGIRPKETPQLYTDEGLYIDVLLRYYYNGDIRAIDYIKRRLRRCYGQALCKLNIIYVEVKINHLKPYSHYEKGLVHELLHIRKYNLPHSKQFNDLVDKILSGHRLPYVRLFLDTPDNYSIYNKDTKRGDLID
jgi:hypothetical protein